MKPKFHLKHDAFVIENYHASRPFAGFLPGIAGEYGKPMWVFTTNRGQGISSFGIRNKNAAMLEFYPANKAYTMTPITGFRTFVRLQEGKKVSINEPFRPHALESVRQVMRVRPHELEIEEVNHANRIEIRVVYFTAPNETLPLLVRRVTVKNLASKTRRMDILDGLPQVVPFGLSEFLLKSMSRTMEAFSETLHTDEHLPFFKMKVEPSDRPEMERIDGGFFAFTLQNRQPIRLAVDAQGVFGADTSFGYPSVWAASGRLSRHEQTESTTACAFACLSFALPAQGEQTFTSYFGQANHWEEALALRRRVQESAAYAETKRAENAATLQQLTDPFAIHSSQKRLDPYSRQAFLDNTLRGGQPRVDKTHGHASVFHYYTRKHGDMERDYNAFEVAPTYFSQGNGNFRDVNQNRRCEPFLFPGVGADSLQTFFNLIQLDGFNPLVIQYETFVVRPEKLNSLKTLLDHLGWDSWKLFLTQPFKPGVLYERLWTGHGQVQESAQESFERILTVAEKTQEAAHGEGFWVDHWIYNLDLLESFAAVYPDQLKAVLTEAHSSTYFDNDHVVQPRQRKTILRHDGRVRQMNAVIRDTEKASLLKARKTDPFKVRTQYGEGEIYRTSLLAKLVGLFAVKAASLDPFGVGLEMEADKPGWCDALNGLPGLFGSSVNEALALRRGVGFLQERLPSLLSDRETLQLPVEVADFVRDVKDALSGASGPLFYRTWDALSSRKEAFRERTRLGVSGEEAVLSLKDLQAFLGSVQQTLDRGLLHAVTKDGLVTTYYINEVDEYEKLPPIHSDASGTEAKSLQAVRAMRFKQTPVVPFLEGPMHALRLASPQEARALYSAVRGSSLSDKKLGLYRLNPPLDSESFEIGRAKIFTPGWLENESIFLHMHYKFLLETLRSGLHAEFFKDFKKGLVAFQDPAVYGRSVYENSSFIASSRFPDARLHGNGFVARLSGATAEWISMVIYMGLGAKPFEWVKGELRFSPAPVLAGWLFEAKPVDGFEKDTFGFKVFGGTWIVYRNPGRRDTYAGKGLAPSSYRLVARDGREEVVEGRFLNGRLAHDLREGRLARVTIHLA